MSGFALAKSGAQWHMLAKVGPLGGGRSAMATRDERPSALSADALTGQLMALSSGVGRGREDPVLAGLVGPEVGDLARRTRWNSLVLNPGSTSTKVSVYSGLTLLAADDIQPEPGVRDDLDGRVDRVIAWMDRVGLDPMELTGIAARGGLMAPVAAGTYRVSSAMLADLAASPVFHPSNLAAPMARRIGERIGPDVLVTTTDPVMIDEIEPAQRLTGSARISDDGTACHYLNHRAVAGLCAQVLGRPLAELHLITCHLGGGSSIVRHRAGRAVQVSPAFGGLPSANRSGALPLRQVMRLMEENAYELDDLRADLTRSGGLVALAGTDDFAALFALSQTGTEAQARKVRLLTDFFANRVAGGILALSADAQPVDAIVLSGGLAHDAPFCERVAERIHLGAPVARLPGALEQSALAAGLLRVSADSAGLQDYTAAKQATARRRQAAEAQLEVGLFEHRAPDCQAVEAPDSLDEIIEAACTDTPATIALVGADNAEALLAIKDAIAHGGPSTPPMARFLLVGRWGPVTQLAWELDLTIDDTVVAVVDSHDPVAAAAELSAQGLADTWMKGSVGTADLLKGYLRSLKAAGALQRRLSHLALFDIPGRDKLVAVTDAAINPAPDVAGRIEILENALAAMRLLGFDRPKVAVLSATEKPSASVGSSVEARQIAEHFAGRDDLIIEGPLALDLALSPDSARDKRYPGQIQGDADLLLVPDIDAGNAIYKAFTVTSDADTAGVVLGGLRPLILTSRGDKARSKLSSIALAVLLTLRGKQIGGGL